jgi:hypothetical protein
MFGAINENMLLNTVIINNIIIIPQPREGNRCI